MSCLVNGVEGAGLAPLDRGLQYGDGVFRSLRVRHGQPIWWEDHLIRLAADADRLGLACPPDTLWRDDLAKLTARLDGGVLKLILTRGVGRRGYLPPDVVQPTRILIYDPVPPASDAWPTTGLNLRLCELRLAAQPRLAGIKHLNRLEMVLARSEWHDPEIHEGLLRDADDHVISGVMSNLFLWSEARLLTPRLDRCGVAGVTRSRLLRRAAVAGLAVEERSLTLEQVYAAEEVMLCNGVIGLQRVARLGAHNWPGTVISPRLRALLHD